ncbi:hypothetical protein AMATHDRAFT_61154 [Amanita thiersii Skay4041]|uniref:Uncharacterized protein n=1 Tax=Amanita thiersii Skay4041 TaxID=703135 RepID=A0A2A9NPW0_9AGAR|nr:hypothetical protein AMATHDRAFT_61154 [Amanita thiersii Skay4041]
MEEARFTTYPIHPARCDPCSRGWCRSDDPRSNPLCAGSGARPARVGVSVRAAGGDAIPAVGSWPDGAVWREAVLVLHAWKDHLWEMGTKGDVPPATPVQTRQVPGEGEGEGEDVGAVKEGEQGQGIQADLHEGSGKDGEASEGMGVSLESGDIPQENGEGETTTVPSLTYTPQEITTLLHKSLLQAISTTLVSLPVSSFPIPSTQFYQNHILPCRPGYPGLVLRPACATDDTTEEEIIMALNPQDISIKTSTHKSLSTFLKAAEKASLVTLKTPQKHSQQTDVLVMSVNGKNAEVTGHVSFVTLREIEEKAAKRASREAGEGVMEELKIRQLWKPHLDSVPVFEGFGVNTKAQYTLEEVKKQLNSYISSQNLVNPQDQAYINLDLLLMACVTAKDRTRTKNKDQEDQELPLGEFIKREDLVKRVVKRMQEWYEIQVPGRDVIRKKGSLKPIKVQAKMRQGGRKASTNVVGFEPFLVVDAEAMAEELRRVCAGSTSGAVTGFTI